MSGSGPHPQMSTAGSGDRSDRSEHPSAGHSSRDSNPRDSRMPVDTKEEPADIKPVLPPTGAGYLPPPSSSVPYPPYHPYYFQGHPGALPPHPSLHPTTGSASSTNSPHPPPVPSLVPIKKEPHSPPPPLKPSEKAMDSQSSSSPHILQRPHPENSGKLPHGYPLTNAPLPPPPLTLIDRDSQKADDLSTPKVERASPHGREGHPLARSDAHHPAMRPDGSQGIYNCHQCFIKWCMFLKFFLTN